MTRLPAGLALVAALVATSAIADVAVPPVARVTDQTGTLSADQRASLAQRLEALEQRKGSQIAVLIVPTTQPETIEQYGIRVGEAWKLGRKGVDDGLILLVAKNDRAVRIEVGYGLEGIVPDAIANRVIDEIIVPRFREGDFYGGISAAVDQLARLVEGEALPAPAPRERSVFDNPYLGNLMFLGFFVLSLSRSIGRRIGELPSSFAFGGLFGGIAWLLLHAVAAAALAGVVMFALSLFMQFGRVRGGGYGGGFGGLGGGFGGGGFGGGFSGGGGGFSGGGASGRW